MRSVRVFFIGGLLSYRALFGWLTPWVFIPSLIVAPIFQILLFAYIGRNTGLESDEFYVVGNAIQYAAIPTVFAMTHTISGERYQNTLGIVLSSPAGRVSLFLGRSVPVVLNGVFVAAFSFCAGVALLETSVPASAIPALALTITLCNLSCTGLGLVAAAIGLRVRDTAVLSNVIFGVLLVFTGANVALASLPPWMATLAAGFPLTHGIEAARRLADGAALADVTGLLGTEALVGAVYAVLGLALLRVAETIGRRRATLEIA